MPITTAATKAHIVNNPSIGVQIGVAPSADQDWIALQDPEDTLVWMQWDDGTTSAIYYPYEGTEITGRTAAHDALDEFLAAGGTILT